MPLVPFSTPQPGRDKRWLLMHSRQAAQAHGSDQILFHDAPPDATTLATIEYVHLWAPPLDPVQQLPDLISRFPSLTHLSIGPGNIQASVVKNLRAEMLPASLRHLSIFDCPGAYTWSAGPMPQLESLEVNVPMRFKAEDFPALKSLSMLPDKAGKLLDQALRLPLQELNLFNVPFDESLFGRIAALPLVSLGLMAGRTLKTLDGIEQLSGLRSLRLKNQQALEAIRSVSALPMLQSIDIQYCKQIADISIIGELDALQKKTLIACGKFKSTSLVKIT
ncbi:leucine-rich repeat domain-containing protein [Achromobacter xylosoxidans]|uniref:leucine-rich repeat domain-containing protein n=1 Tax=Alcaligenes xylosoxydans xylosoxydans TaxID=85698 RepID=UPI002ACAA148|nr:leucine-rich repeat domain-containing protein [Achromobacter xylosoxidans]MDZ5614608.1 leucine-rich repeat domain-containing protein [Achromobacter xylosoxidans]MDZ5625401.1 leucine-rich repeat domain-containing protein [Achromobacter xylosoxidans]MDZ5685604.1 leucine-rich repeat domain-containing protein [Achromobacter xylosoxidans]